jgi:CRP/FNR family transcriptional regulator, cyclic AMP receptor protein
VLSLPSGSFLAGLSVSARSAMLGLGVARDYGAGTILLREGERSSHVLVLVKGLVKVTATSPEGHLSLLAIRTAGDLIGELASMDDEPRIATVTSAGPVRARVVTQAEFRRFLTGHPDVALAVSTSVGVKLRWATRRRIDFGAHEVQVRLAKVLVELATTYRTDEGEMDIPLSQPELAALVGAAEPTVHRALAYLRKMDIVTTGYRRVVVRDRARLEAVADRD